MKYKSLNSLAIDILKGVRESKDYTSLVNASKGVLTNAQQANQARQQIQVMARLDADKARADIEAVRRDGEKGLDTNMEPFARDIDIDNDSKITRHLKHQVKQKIIDNT